MSLSARWRATMCGLISLTVALGLWSLIRDYRRARDDGLNAAGVVALRDSLTMAQRQGAVAVDALLAAQAERDIALIRYRASRRGDAPLVARDSAVRDSLRDVVAEALTKARDSSATVDSLRAVVAVVVRAGAERGRVDSLAIGRLSGRLLEAEGVIRADSVNLRAFAVALDAVTLRAGLAERLGDGYKGQRDAARRSTAVWKLAAMGAGLVAVLAAVR